MIAAAHGLPIALVLLPAGQPPMTIVSSPNATKRYVTKNLRAGPPKTRRVGRTGLMVRFNLIDYSA